MHVLDGKINDIEKRIQEVITFAPKQEGITMQTTVLSYGWILLDSWVAWRTLRFLLRNVSTVQKIQEKWLQTPSSYSASQIGAVWGFSDLTQDYFKRKIGEKAKGIFDDLIQKKRNASAHFSQKSGDSISGSDVIDIDSLFKGLSTVFLFYELKAFWTDTESMLKQRGYDQLTFSFSPGDSNKRLTIESFEEALLVFERTKGYEVYTKNKDEQTCWIKIKDEPCLAGSSKFGTDILFESVVKNSDGKYYNFLGNKGYYVHIDKFVDALEKCWIAPPDNPVAEKDLHTVAFG